MDSSHVALVSLFLSFEGFEKYVCQQKYVIGINIMNLFKVLKLADTVDSISLMLQESKPDVLMIQLQNPKSGRVIEFSLNLLQLDVDQLTIPVTDSTSIITINADQFTKYCRDLSQLSDTMIISTKPGEVLLNIDGAAGFGFIKLTNDHDTEKAEDKCQIELEEPVTQTFALTYLNLFNRASSLSSFTRLYMHKDQPLIVEFRIDGLGMLKYYLAPKVDDS